MMPQTHTVLKVFLASPSDVEPERDVLDSVITRVNATLGERHGITLSLRKWETATYPDFGLDSQSVINEQIGRDYDIFVGIMWSRFGTETPRAGSGTEEEFKIAYSRYKKGDRVRLMFFFKEAPIPYDQADGEQINQVKAFRNRISEDYGGLYHTFTTKDEFDSKIFSPLTSIVAEWSKHDQPSKLSPVMPNTTNSTSSARNPLAQLELADSELVEEGLLDTIVRGMDAIHEVAAIVGRMTSATADIGNKCAARTLELRQLGIRTDPKRMSQLLTTVADDFDVFVKRLALEIPEFHKQHSIFTDTLKTVALSAETDSVEDNGEIMKLLSNLQLARSAIDNCRVDQEGFADSVRTLPRLSTALNRSRRRALAVIDDTVEQLRVASSELEAIERLFRQLLRPER